MAEPFIGQIMVVGFNFAPRGWATCDGQLLPISQNSALFSLLGTTYGGDGRTTFALPELRGRSPIGVGNGPGLSPVSWGEKSGQENVTIGINNMPSHNHSGPGQLSFQANADGGLNSDPNNRYLGPANIYTNDAGDLVNLHSTNANITTANNGGGQQMNNMQPYLGMYHCIALTGIFPSRN